MTDAEPPTPRIYKRGLRVDVPCSWLTAPWWDLLTMYERGVYVSALMWSQGQQLDGQVPRSALRFIDVDLQQVEEAMDSICKKTQRLERTLTGWQFVDWETMQEQSTSHQIATQRERVRVNQAQSRDRRRRKGSVTDDVAGDVGKATTDNGR